MGTETLPSSVAGEIHAAIADAYFEERTIGPTDAMQILVHLFAAKRWLRLAGFLLQLSADVRTERDAQFFQLVPLLLRPLPNEIPRSAQIGILAAQIRIARLTNADQTAELEKDFRAVATNPDSESLLGA